MWKRVKLFAAWVFDWFILPLIEMFRHDGGQSGKGNQA